MTIPEWTIAMRIRSYRGHVKDIPYDYTFEVDVLEALIGRSCIQERWDELTEAEREEVTRIDADLVRLHDRVAEMLPPRGMVPPMEEWWWHLDDELVVKARMGA